MATPIVLKQPKAMCTGQSNKCLVYVHNRQQHESFLTNWHYDPTNFNKMQQRGECGKSKLSYEMNYDISLHKADKVFPIKCLMFNLYLVVDLLVTHSGVTIHSAMIQFVLGHNACYTLHDTIFAIHIYYSLFIHELPIAEDWRDRIHSEIGYCM